MTRDKDFFVELERRAQIANNAKADLFISIHANSNPKPTPYGTETYAMGLHKSKQNLAVAQKENSVILQEVNYQKRYNGFNPNSPEAYIIFTMFQNVYLDRSLKLANLVEKNFASIAHRSDRGVKQAGFWVLWRTAMPSILIETGFVSNPAEGKYLASEKGQDQLAYAIFKAFQSYKDDFESQLPQDTEKETPSAVNKDLVYKVQIASSKQKIDPLKNTEFKNLSDVDFFESNGWYKYTTGRFYQFDEANTAFQEIKKQYKDAFLVAFYKGKKISVKKAHKLEKKLREKN
jgi:N-acetylmuramoyl-L-alanine amidase